MLKAAIRANAKRGKMKMMYVVRELRSNVIDYGSRMYKVKERERVLLNAYSYTDLIGKI